MMNKTMKRVLCLLLALLMVMAIVGCEAAEQTEQTERVKKTKKTLVGQWAAELDYAEFMNEVLFLEIDLDYEFEDLVFTLELTFHEDGTYKMTMDGDIEGMITQMADVLWDYSIELSAEQYGVSASEMEEMMEQQGYTKEDMLEEMDMDTALEEMEKGNEGKWLLEDDKLYLAEEDPKDENPVIIEFDGGDVLSFVEMSGDDEEIEELEILSETLLPLTFERVG